MDNLTALLDCRHQLADAQERITELNAENDKLAINAGNAWDELAAARERIAELERLLGWKQAMRKQSESKS